MAPLPDLDNPAALADRIAVASKSGEWIIVAALIANAIVWVLRRPAITEKIPFFATQKGGFVLALLIGAGTVFSFQAAAGLLTLSTLLECLLGAFSAMGQYHAKRDVAGEGTSSRPAPTPSPAPPSGSLR